MMIALVLAVVSLHQAPAENLTAEGERLGRYSTLFALCDPYYATDIAAGRRLANDFQRRASDAGWTSVQWSDAYDRGRDLERAELGVVLDATGVTRQEARRYLRQLYPRLKLRCQDLAKELPGSISDVADGDRRIEAAIRRFR